MLLVLAAVALAAWVYLRPGQRVTIDDAADVLAGDSEEAPGGPGPLGQNHPVRGTTPITMGPPGRSFFSLGGADGGSSGGGGGIAASPLGDCSLKVTPSS